MIYLCLNKYPKFDKEIRFTFQLGASDIALITGALLELGLKANLG